MGTTTAPAPTAAWSNDLVTKLDLSHAGGHTRDPTKSGDLEYGIILFIMYFISLHPVKSQVPVKRNIIPKGEVTKALVV